MAARFAALSLARSWWSRSNSVSTTPRGPAGTTAGGVEGVVVDGVEGVVAAWALWASALMHDDETRVTAVRAATTSFMSTM